MDCLNFKLKKVLLTSLNQDFELQVVELVNHNQHFTMMSYLIRDQNIDLGETQRCN